MKMTEEIRNNLLTIKGLSDDIKYMDSGEPAYDDFVSRIVEAKQRVIETIADSTIDDYLINNFTHFIKSAFSKKDLTDLI